MVDSFNKQSASDLKRPFDLKSFLSSPPPGVELTNSSGRLVFGGRAVDTLPYRIAPGAAAAINEKDVLNTPIQTQVLVGTYDLADANQLEQYGLLLNAVSTGWFKMLHIERHWDSQSVPPRMRVYAEVLVRERLIKALSEYDALNSERTRPIV